MIHQRIKEGNHNWEKQNLVTLGDKRGGYDVLHCKCGLKGKSRQLGRIDLDGRQGAKAKKCTYHLKEEKDEVGKQIKVTHCQAQGRQFANIVDGSTHTLITPPKGRGNDEYWVQGVGEPIRLLWGEFDFV